MSPAALWQRAVKYGGEIHRRIQGQLRICHRPSDRRSEWGTPEWLLGESNTSATTEAARKNNKRMRNAVSVRRSISRTQLAHPTNCRRCVLPSSKLWRRARAIAKSPNFAVNQRNDRSDAGNQVSHAGAKAGLNEALPRFTMLGRVRRTKRDRQ